MAKVLFGALSVAASAANLTWQDYKMKYGLNFNGDSEDEYRRGIFEKNSVFIKEQNEQGHSYKLSVNRFAHLTQQEMSVMKGLKRSRKEAHLPELEGLEEIEVAASIDWREQGILNPIKDQGNCGSCWAFGAVAVIESNYALKTGQLMNLAEQQLVDCSGSAGDCDGGDEWEAVDWYAGSSRRRASSPHGVCTTSSYAYTARDQTCKESSCTFGINEGVITGYILGSYQSDSSMISYLNNGPVSAGVWAGRSWDYYDSGIVGDACKDNDQDHAILVVGYTADAYIVRNSWGRDWGESGHIRLKRGLSGDGASCILQWEPMQPKFSMSTEAMV